MSRDDEDPSAAPSRGTGHRAARGSVDAGRLWAGGAATALVAALVAAVALLVWTVAFDVTPVAPDWLVGDGQDATLTTRFALTAALAGVLATGLLHLLMLSTRGRAPSSDGSSSWSPSPLRLPPSASTGT